MGEQEQRREQLWSFREGTLSADDSVKNFQVEASDGHAGKVSWASYAPGESYLVVSHTHHFREAHHVVPAGAVERISTDERTVWLVLAAARSRSYPSITIRPHRWNRGWPMPSTGQPRHNISEET